MAAESGSPSRECPRCETACSVVEHNGVELDHCPRCRGTFLEAGEAAEIFGPYVEPATWKQARDTEHLADSDVACPADGAVFEVYRVALAEDRWLFGPRHESVRIELCPECGGMWLEPEEGKRLREIVMAAGQTSETELSDFAANPGIGAYLFQLASGLPMEAWNPQHRFPTVSTGLLGLFGLAFLATIGASSPENVIATFGMIPAEIRQGQALWTMLSSAFLHGGLLHLAVNAYFLYVFGTNVEDVLGGLRFVGLFVVTALAGSGLEAALTSQPTVPVVGASGAIAGMMGAYLVLFPRVKVFLVLLFIRFRLGIAWYLGLWVGLNLVMALAGSAHVAAWAHLGGFLAGVAIGYAYRIRPLAEVLRPATS